MRRKESVIQEMCVRWFRLQFPSIGNLLFAVPNGGSRNIREAANLKKEGVTAGVSDLIFLFPCGGYGALCIEMKTDDKSSRQRQSQKEWQALVESVGVKYVVCRSLADFVEEIKLYLQPVKEAYFGL